MNGAQCRQARGTAGKAVHFIGTALLFPRFGSFVQIATQFFAMDHCWAFTINRTQSVLEPATNCVDVNVQKVRDFRN